MKSKRKKAYPWQRKRRRVIIVLVVLCTPFLVLAVYRSQLRQQTDVLIQEIREKGMPVTMEELEARYPDIPRNPDVEALYYEAVQAYKKILPRKMDKIPLTQYYEKELLPGEAIPPESMQILGEYLELNAQTLRLLHEAAEYPPYVFPSDTLGEPPQQVNVPYAVETGVSLLLKEALYSAQQQDEQRAARALLDALHLSRCRVNLPARFSFMAGDLGEMVKVYPHVLSRVALKSDDLKTIINKLNSFDFREDLYSRLLWQQCHAIYYQRHLLTELKDAPPPFKIFLAGYILLGQNEKNLTCELEINGGLLNSTTLPFWELRRVQLQLNGLFPRKRSGYYLASGNGVYSHWVGYTGRAEAGIQLLTGACALYVYRNEHHRWPERLDALVPEILDEVPVDPYDGNPLRYQVKEDKFVLYSIGFDGQDNQGTPPRRWGRRQGGVDYVFNGVAPQ